MKKTLIFAFSILLLSCIKEPEGEPLSIDGLKPVYSQNDSFTSIASHDPQAFNRVGKIYKNGQYIYISDKGTGVHVINNSDPSNPVKEAFISVPLNFDMVSRLGALYADSGSDLVTIDISDLNNAHEVLRIEDVYESAGLDGSGELYPMFYSGYFECVDQEKGRVIDWEDALLTDPKCRR